MAEDIKRPGEEESKKSEIQAEETELKSEGFGAGFSERLRERVEAFTNEIIQGINDPTFIARTEDAKKVLLMRVNQIISPETHDYDHLRETLVKFAEAHKFRRENTGQTSDLDPQAWADEILNDLKIADTTDVSAIPLQSEPVNDTVVRLEGSEEAEGHSGIEPTETPPVEPTSEPAVDEAIDEEEDEAASDLSPESIRLIDDYVREHPQFTWAKRIIAVQQRTQDIIATIAIKLANQRINELIGTRLQGSDSIGVVRRDVNADSVAIDARQRDISKQNRNQFIEGNGGLIDRLYGSRIRRRQLNNAETTVNKWREERAAERHPSDEEIMLARTARAAEFLRETDTPQPLTGREIRRQEKFQEQLALHQSINITREQAEAMYWQEQRDRVGQQVEFLRSEMEIANEELTQSKQEVKEIEQSRQRLKSTIKIFKKHPPEDSRGPEYERLMTDAEERLRALDQTMEVVAANIAGQTALIEQYRISIDQICFIAGLSNREPDVKKSRAKITDARNSAMDGLEDYFKRLGTDIPEVEAGDIGSGSKTNRPSSVFLNFFLSTIMGVNKEGERR